MSGFGEPGPPDERPGSWRVVRRLVRWIVPEPYREAFLGDLIEEWGVVIRPRLGPRRAAGWLWGQVLGSVWPMLRRRAEREVPMLIRKAAVRTLLGYRLSDEAFDSRLGLWACTLGGVAVVPVAIVALLRHPGGRADFFLGVVLAAVVGLLCLVLGLLCRHGIARMDRLPMRRRRAELAGYLGCIGLLIGGIRILPGLGLSPAGITVALLAICAASLAVLVSGMLTTLGMAPERRE